MASGRGWILQQHIRLQKPGPAAQTQTPSLPSQTPTLKVQHRGVKISNAASDKKSTSVRKAIRPTPLPKKTCLSQATYIESAPCEILLKIFSYLDPISLMSVGSVNKRFYELSKDNVLWYKIYISRWKVNHRWKYDSVNSLEKRLSDTAISDPDPAYWKKSYIRELIRTREKKLAQILKSVKSSSGMPAYMERAVKVSGLVWNLTFLDTNGVETVIGQTDTYFRDSSLTVTWKSYIWPEFHTLTKIQLHGVTPVLTDKCLKPIKNGLQRLSLIAEYDLKDKQVPGRYIGQDIHVKIIHLHPGLIVGLWKKGSEIAFVMGTLHYHQLLEKSFLGSAGSPYTFPVHVPILDDIDPEYGLHGYQLHIDMYSECRTYLCKTFRGMFCRKEYIKNGYLRMTAIGFMQNRMHTAVAGTVGFFWETLTISGSIKNCFLMDVTVSDESQTPYWCFSAPVKLHEIESSETLFDYMGQSFELNYTDDMGKVHAELMWMKEAEEFYVINLVVYLNTEKVNSYFGTNYTDSV
ncbi:F-box only protein 15 isoform X2 [Hyla sarda]|uniref:F-box only protein 15 isoform X2 n=1 Tax=Hyla sarda TaxID=327740 RepID=UPI0024C3C2BB|nr:F-box only protein 15 isoform X2 [Hyla sarda]